MRTAAVGNTVLKVTLAKQPLSRREMAASLLALSYVTSAAVLPNESQAVLVYSLSGIALGAVWGYARRVLALGLLVRCVALTVALWSCVAVATQAGMRYLVIPTGVFPNRFAQAILSLYDTARVSGDVMSTPAVLAVAIGFSAVVGALAVGDAVKGAVFRILTVVLLPTAFAVYRSEMRNAWCVAVMTASALLLLSLTNKHRVQGVGKRTSQRLVAAVRFLSVVTALVFLATGPTADALQREVVERLHSVVVPPEEKIKRTEYIPFANAEQAAAWVSRNVSLTEQLAGDVNAVLEQQRGNAAQLASLSAALTNAGGVRVDIMLDGTVRLKIPTSLPPLTLNTAPTGSLPAPTTPATAQESLGVTTLPEAVQGPGGSDVPAPAPGGSAAVTAPATTPPTASPTSAGAAIDTPTSQSSGDLKTLVVTAALLLLTAAAWLALRRKRRTAQLGAESEAIRSWRRVEKKLEKQFRSVHQETMTYRERHSQVGPGLKGAGPQHQLLAEAVDAAVYGPAHNVDRQAAASSDLSALVLETIKEETRG